jgi:hypothetical protein
MKFFWIITAALILMTGCRETKEEPDLQPLTRAEISGTRLWQRITEESDYTAYGQWAGHQGLRPGQSPHGSLHKVFINKPLHAAVPLEEAVAPEGSILIKENYNASEELVNLTVMAKVKDYSPETSDWFWAAFSPEGQVRAEGSPGGCVSCHEGMKQNDYIIIKSIDEPQGAF